MSKIEKFEAKNYTELLEKINNYAKKENLNIIDFTTSKNNNNSEALVLFMKN